MPNEQKTTETPFKQAMRLHRAKLVASILTANGMPVTPPDEADLDDVERERWNVCVEIERALSGG